MLVFEQRVKEAETALCKIDPKLGNHINSGPTFDYAPFNKEPFEALVHAVIAQQLSVKSAHAIRQRVHMLLAKDKKDALAFSKISSTELKQAGLSQAKTNTVQTLTQYALDDNNQFDKLHRCSDTDIKERLCQLKGVGPWTVDIFLMFGLKRLDVFAAGDLGLRKAVKLINKSNTLPTPAECAKIATKWQPYRTIAAWHLWRTVD
jgi:DNA-3-methyladenine glycosylase II